MVGTCFANGMRITPPFFSTASNSVDQQIPLNSVESLTTNLNLCPPPLRNLSSTPAQFLTSSDTPFLKGVLRMPTNPPLLASVTVPVHIPVLLSMVEEEAPPITTSSRGAKLKKFWEEEGVHSVSPGPIFRLVPFFPPPMNGREGGVTNLELWLTNRKISHGFRSSLSLSAAASLPRLYEVEEVWVKGCGLKALASEIVWKH
mmetsp:Transcript_22923/g.49593  ORF Transcript_22923/g.49593 Transcript_22923/m.49593 type:complete len:202 (-) Transcript_22923:188-793(-)